MPRRTVRTRPAHVPVPPSTAKAISHRPIRTRHVGGIERLQRRQRFIESPEGGQPLGELVAFLLPASLVACAAAPSLNGAVTPVQGGMQQSVVKGLDKTSARRAFAADAKTTCGKSSPIKFMSTDDKYTVVSQTSNEKAGKKIESDNKKMDAGIAVGLRYIGLESKDSDELTTLFKCEPLPP